MPSFSSVCKIVKEAGSFLYNRELSERKKEKSSADYVTETDIAVQTFLREKLGKLCPNIAFLGEEQEAFHWDFQKPVWVLDPVDGTTNLIHGFQHSAVSLALVESNQPRMGIVYNPYSREMFTARRFGGAFLNGERIWVSGNEYLSDSIISIGTSPGNRAGSSETFSRMKRIFENCQDIRRMGAASLELCYVACGRLDGFFEEHLKPWDYAAGMLVVEEAGGRALNRYGRMLTLRPDGEVLATNGRITEEILKFL